MKIAFLDRDGVINREVNYLYRIEDFEFTPNCIVGLKRLIESGYKIVIVTNQAGIARGYYTTRDYELLTDWYCSELEKHGVNILDVFHCPHHPEGSVSEFSIECDCRKPNIGMLELAARKYDVDLHESLLIGDKESDLLAGKKFGLSKLYMVETGHAVNLESYDKYDVYPDIFSIPL
ncbi:D-glycero-beta-D-manno-heptose 1,7-bisphosphate 7-phosphatase [Vibrio cholerae]|nr:D-glycero-beta-D-manno-heptose 1,7-bisphosphate 7-phosphatase [Vibrio cholerae]EJY0884459.1 HAD family hydrolase [Vibrio cholerae]BCN19545.1 putative monosaccharide biosynthesis protein [Vibrio cholerae]GHW83619.1 D,D-heptose 1,7-bisphosphate phosphatase [Vibrio cholerae]